MTTFISIALLFSVAVISFGAEINPQKPTPAEVSKILGIDESRVSAADKDQNPKLAGKLHWLATYKIAGDQELRSRCFRTIESR